MLIPRPHPPLPYCEMCWAEKLRMRRTVVTRLVKNAKIELCCMCGNDTQSGLYLRTDPTTVKYLRRAS